MKAGEQPVIFGDGTQSRDFTYVANVVKANLLACSDAAEEFSGEVFNIACGQRVTLNALVETINASIDMQIEPKYSEPRPGDVMHSLANIGKARQFLHYNPETKFEEGIKLLIA